MQHGKRCVPREKDSSPMLVRFTFHLLDLESVCLYPIKVRLHTGVDSRIVGEGTAHCPRNETNEFSIHGQRATGITLRRYYISVDINVNAIGEIIANYFK